MRILKYIGLIIIFSLAACQTALPTDATPLPGVNYKETHETLIPAGSFTMGSDMGFSDEQPVHEVSLSAFYIDTYEVTNYLYAQCVNDGKCSEPAGKDSVTRSNYYGNTEFNNYPVLAVNWNQASTYCAWRGARLPSETEWERAARGTNPQTFPWGETSDRTRANYNVFVGDTAAIGSYEAGKSPEGVYDLAGNVSEWVNDWYQVYPGGDPAGGSYGEVYRVIRGGSWQDKADSIASTSRSWDEPKFVDYHVGFRCARTP